MDLRSGDLALSADGTTLRTLLTIDDQDDSAPPGAVSQMYVS